VSESVIYNQSAAFFVAMSALLLRECRRNAQKQAGRKCTRVAVCARGARDAKVEGRTSQNTEERRLDYRVWIESSLS
jgi:hypothetical protein